MARDFIINGETLVKVKNTNGFGSALAQELGLAGDKITINFKFKHKDILADDFGPDIPAEVMYNLTEAQIKMTLVHYDDAILRKCVLLAMGGGTEGVLQGAGTLLGRGQPGLIGTAGSPTGVSRYISLNLSSPVLNKPWRFPTAYLMGQPHEVPLSTGYSMVQLTWRAIAYGFDSAAISNKQITSQGKVLWDYTADA